MIIKRALRRDPSVPVGQPAPLHLLCGCTTEVPVVADVQTCATCGQAYDARGYLIVVPSWSGAPCAVAPDTCWIDDVTGDHVDTMTGTRTTHHPA
jgi:hypothetical protein